MSFVNSYNFWPSDKRLIQQGMSNYPQILTSTCVDIGTLVPTTLHSLIQKKKKNRFHNLNLLINKSHSLVQQQQKNHVP